MTGFEVYKMYLALKQHFTKEKYDYHKYRGKVRASEDAFEQRHDRYFFKKLATKYSDPEILDYFVANFVSDPKGYIKSGTRFVSLKTAAGKAALNKLKAKRRAQEMARKRLANK